MQTRLLLSVAAVVLSSAAAGYGQTTPPPPPSTSQPTTAPAPDALPPATPQPAQQTQAMPPYAGQQMQPQTTPTATPAPPPVVAPQQPTPAAPYAAMPAYNKAPAGPYVPYGVPNEDRKPEHYGSTYIPVDSWIYPEMTRLYSLGYVNTMFLGMRPWTRQSLLHMLEDSEDDIRNGDSDEAREIYFAVLDELKPEQTDGITPRGSVYGIHTAYTRALGITSTPLRDSDHLGQTIVNDYGRPYQGGFNALTGVSALAERGRFSFYVRGEYQHAPSATGYSQALSAQLSAIDLIPFSGYNLHQATIPTGPIGSQNPFRILEADVSYHLLGDEISFGKTDSWMGPGKGGAMAWSNNAEDIYAFRVNRVEPLKIPLLWHIIGPGRYDFFIGSLQGHTDTNHPYADSFMFSFRPTTNFEFAFQRTIVFGGAGHSPVTLHTFLKGFFSYTDTTESLKLSRDDPGARYSDFSLSYRLPLLRKYATFYFDSISHDDVTPISAPRRAAYRPGIYISQFPFARKLDFRVEAASTDPGVTRSMGGQFNYFEIIHKQAYTNKGFIMGDWIGREAKGGQAWLTYHLSGNEWVQLEYLNKKTPKDFIPLGTTQNQFKVDVVKRFAHDSIEMNAWFQYERWKAPVYLPGARSDTATAVQLTFFPALHSRASN